MHYVDKFILDQSRFGLPMTVSGVAQQGTSENYVTAGVSKNKRRKRGRRQVKRQQELWKGRCTLIRIDTLSIGTMTGRGRELADMTKQRNVDILCLQDTK